MSRAALSGQVSPILSIALQRPPRLDAILLSQTMQAHAVSNQVLETSDLSAGLARGKELDAQRLYTEAFAHFGARQMSALNVQDWAEFTEAGMRMGLTLHHAARDLRNVGHCHSAGYAAAVALGRLLEIPAAEGLLDSPPLKGTPGYKNIREAYACTKRLAIDLENAAIRAYTSLKDMLVNSAVSAETRNAVLYNRACSEAALGRSRSATQTLSRALDMCLSDARDCWDAAHYNDVMFTLALLCGDSAQNLARDEDLDSLAAMGVFRSITHAFMLQILAVARQVGVPANALGFANLALVIDAHRTPTDAAS